MRFSVIVPAHNSEGTIGRAIASVLEQTCDGWELIVVDDGSTDETLLRAGAAALGDPRVTLLSQRNAGAARARNLGAGQAVGEWLVFLDADDALESGYLRRIEQAAREDEGLAVVGMNGLKAYPDGSQRPAYPGSAPVEITLADQITQSRLTVTSALRRDVFEALGGFRDTYAEDYDLWLRVLAAGHRAFRIPELLVRYDATRADAKSRTREPEIDSVVDSLDALLHAGSLESDHVALAERTLRRLRAERALVPVKAAVRSGQYGGARAAFWRHRNAMPGSLRRATVLAVVTVSPRLYRRVVERIDPSA